MDRIETELLATMTDDVGISSTEQVEEERAADVSRRIRAAELELAALCARHQVEFSFESGQSTRLGTFTRIVFYDARPPVDVVRNGRP
jgi:hypothetical protein